MDTYLGMGVVAQSLAKIRPGNVRLARCQRISLARVVVLRRSRTGTLEFDFRSATCRPDRYVGLFLDVQLLATQWIDGVTASQLGYEYWVWRFGDPYARCGKSVGEYAASRNGSAAASGTSDSQCRRGRLFVVTSLQTKANVRSVSSIQDRELAKLVASHPARGIVVLF